MEVCRCCYVTSRGVAKVTGMDRMSVKASDLQDLMHFTTVT